MSFTTFRNENIWFVSSPSRTKGTRRSKVRLCAPLRRQRSAKARRSSPTLAAAQNASARMTALPWAMKWWISLALGDEVVDQLGLVPGADGTEMMDRFRIGLQD